MELKNNLAEEEIIKFLNYMKKIGYDEKEIIEKIKTMNRGEQ